MLVNQGMGVFKFVAEPVTEERLKESQRELERIIEEASKYLGNEVVHEQVQK